jgi:hypothetical protein
MNNVVEVGDFFFKKLTREKINQLKSIKSRCKMLIEKLPNKNLSLSEIPIMIALCECQHFVELIANGASKQEIKNHLFHMGEIFAKENGFNKPENDS